MVPNSAYHPRHGWLDGKQWQTYIDMGRDSSSNPNWVLLVITLGELLLC